MRYLLIFALLAKVSKAHFAEKQNTKKDPETFILHQPRIQALIGKRLRYLIGILLAFLSPCLIAQSFGEFRQIKVKPLSDTLQIDSLSLIPSSVQISGFDSLLFPYQVDVFAAKLIFLRKGQRPDSLEIRYKVFPINFSQPYLKRRPTPVNIDERGVFNPYVFNTASANDDVFRFEGLNKSGSISRGVGFGNNQDLAVNSTLNLQLSGNLTPDIELSAAITDDNIPIQPQGNTQQLQDFDRVYIQLKNKQHKLIVGDFQVTRPESYFMNFNKRLQGLSYTGSYQPIQKNPRLVSRTGGHAAVARGRFHRNSFLAIEGNQGPYRLRGASNEQFIIVLSGSEKVYIDGRLLVRGQENDYIIDYNTAEIIFTTRNLMTKDLRIFVEFEYSDKNYVRSLFYVQQELEVKEKWKVALNVFSEQDSRNQPLQQQLTEAQKQALSEAGDNLSLAVVPAIDSVPYSPDNVLYALRDTLVDNVLYQNILVFSNNPNAAFYRATFSNVGANNGNYVQLPSAANGRVFGWVAPINGVPQGSFAPVRQLIPPTSKQLVTLGAAYQLSKNIKVGAEWAFSNFDQNTFSPNDAENNQGYAYKAFMQHSYSWGKDSLNPWILTSEISLEQVSAYFTPQERWRNVEFERDWNLQQLNVEPQTPEWLPSVSLLLHKKGWGRTQYQATYFNKGNIQRSLQQNLITDFTWQKFQINYIGSLTESTGASRKFDFYRHRTHISRPLTRKFTIGYKDEFEDNRIINIPGDTLLANAYRFFDRQGYISLTDSSRTQVSLSYRVRTDDGVRNQRLNNYAVADWASISVKRNWGEKAQISNISSLRRLRITSDGFINQSPENTLVNRLDGSFRIAKGVLTGNVFFEVGSGLETRKEFSYLQVPAGQGVYAWVDYNGNGIKELDEFEIAAFSDQAQYIRIYLPTNDFIRAYSNQFSETINLKAPAAWSKGKKWKKAISLLAGQSNYRTDTRIAGSDMLNAYNPFANQENNSDLISNNTNLRNTLFINRNGSKFAIDLNFQRVYSRVLLINGFEVRSNRFGNHRLRYNFTDNFTLNAEVRQGRKENLAELFTNRNFSIAYGELLPALSWQPNGAVRITANYRWALKDNAQIYGGQRAVVNSLGLDGKYNVTSTGSFQGRFNLVLISYADDPNTPIAFEMLEALRPGQNYTWNISYQRSLSSNMQLNLIYEGRKSPDVKFIHTGNVQVRAFF